MVKFTIVILLALNAMPVFAGKVLLVWDANPPGENVLSYGVYEFNSATKTYAYYGQVSTNRAVVLDVALGDHCFVVTALNEFGESAYSEQACIRVESGSLNSNPHLDLQAPTAAFTPLPESSSAQIPLEWSGGDGAGGSGGLVYDVAVSVNGGPRVSFLRGTNATSTLYVGQAGNRYEFYGVARDRAGNRSPEFSAHTIAVANTAPRVQPTRTLEVNAGQLMVVTNRAIDLDLPPQKLTFSLVEAQGSGARVDSRTGTFFWRPTGAEASRTNYFAVRVADNFIPSLSSTQRLAVAVRDYAELSVGSVTVRSGNEAVVPVTVFSSVPFRSISAVLEVPDGVVVGMVFEGSPTAACGSHVWEETPGNWMLSLWSCQGDWRGRREIVGNLRVRFAAPRSMFLPLLVKVVVVEPQDSLDIPHTAGVSGRIVVVQDEPLLEVQPREGQAVAVQLYGIPGLTYALDVNSNPTVSGGWAPNWQGTLTSEMKEFVLPAKWSYRLFFRARRVP